MLTGVTNPVGIKITSSKISLQSDFFLEPEERPCWSLERNAFLFRPGGYLDLSHTVCAF